jgi:hypothetical protein
MRVIEEYQSKAASFEKDAANETDKAQKEALLECAQSYRALAEQRAIRLGIGRICDAAA